MIYDDMIIVLSVRREWSYLAELIMINIKVVMAIGKFKLFSFSFKFECETKLSYNHDNGKLYLNWK